MIDSVMLYKYPGKHRMHGDMFDYVIIHYSELYKYLENGWHKTTQEAKESYNNLPASQKPVKKKKKKRKKDLRSSEVRRIKNSTGTIKEVAKRYNVTEYAVKTIRG